MNIITLERHVGAIWRTYTYDMDRGPDIAKYVARERYAWPGGYELFAITDDGGILCNDCCRTEFYQIRTAVPGDGWNVTACDSTAMQENGLTCDHCNRVIVEAWDAIPDDAIPSDAELYLDSARGVYIPQQCINQTRPECLSGISDDDRETLLAGPDHEYYWDVWNDALVTIRITNPDTGMKYRLHQDGDLWLIPITDKEHTA